MAHPFNEIFRYGSASLATESDLRRARMFEFDGPHVGYHGGRTLRLPGDAPLVTFGGAGSGKLRDLLGHVVCDSPGIPILILDPRGELAAISRHMHAAHGEDAWHWNPTGLCGLPSNRCNPLDILTPNSPTLHADCAFLAEGLIPLTGGGTGRYFELRAREWVPIATRLGTRRARVITEPVPRHLADYPQYRNGTWSYVEGFKPN